MSFSAKHPKGLYLLFATEMWERFSYYGMRAIFILYMTQALLFNKELASEIYGSYTGLVYLTPLIGGYIADRYWGNRKSIVFGAVIMALGQFFMFLSACFHQQTGLSVPLMFLGLFTLIMGNGFFKPNISTMVGDLYEPTDHRKDSAFTIFYMGVNVGSFIAPLWCGFVGDTGNPDDFKWGFLSACVGMILGTVLFCAFKNKYIVTPEGAPIGTVPAAKANAQQATASTQQTGVGTQQVAAVPAKSGSSRKTILGILSAVVLFLLFSINWNYLHDWNRIFEGADLIGTAIYAISIVVPVIIITDKSLTRIEQARIGVIYIIAFFVIFFWSAYSGADRCASAGKNRLCRRADRPPSGQLGNAGFLLPVVQPGDAGVPHSALHRSMGCIGQTRSGTVIAYETGHRSVAAGCGLCGHRFRSEGSGPECQSQHVVAHQSVYAAHHGRNLSLPHRSVYGKQTLSGTFLLTDDGCVVHEYGSSQQVCRHAEQLLS